MNIAFTICSNNYLAHAKTLGDSFLEFHPNWKFIIGLVDELDSSFDYSLFNNFEIIKVADIKVPEFENIVKKYDIIELNTAVKPTFIKHVFTNYNANKLIYIDPDILVTSYFEEVITILDSRDIVLTPHICSPIDDDYAPTDYHTLRGGVYNLGFIALARYDKIKDFIKWWDERVLKYGFCDFSKNMFYDQIWINYVPAMWDNYHIIKHLGYNMANWNLHERILTNTEKEIFCINQQYPLRFFHFSGYKYDNSSSIASYLTRYNFESRPDLKYLFSLYNDLLKNNKIEHISKLRVYYQLENKNAINPSVDKSLLSKIMNRLKITIKVFLTGHE
ncbi:hypothetical protein ACM55K_10520 [Flavobacterium sp. LT1R49]|uniref:hypothetical protein n=1 Tax=Flavobacterium arabinosi TaxID=3398737 RepID=UPI003A861670